MINIPRYKSNGFRDHGNDKEVKRLLDRQVTSLVELAENVYSGYDCDSDAHKYGTPCRKCMAEDVLKYLVEEY